jgi:hypothetical protein
MKIYLLIIDMGYDGISIIDPFSTKEKALIAQAKDSEKYSDNKPFGDYKILELEVL